MEVTIEEVLALVCVQLGRRGVLVEDRLMEDLGAESADIVNLVAAVEDRFGVSIDEAGIAGIRTVGDLYKISRGLF
jgi:acyl carrier protein